MTQANSNEYGRKALMYVDTNDTQAIVFALLAIAEEVEALTGLFASVMRQDGGLVVEVSN